MKLDLSLRKEEHRLRVFENRVLKRDEMITGWRKLHNEELHNLYRVLAYYYYIN
jgi:hypothetical protein